MSLDYKLRRFLTGLTYPPKLWNPVWMAPVEPKMMASLFDEPPRVEDLYSEAIDVWDQSRSRNLTDCTLEFFTNLYLQDDILTKADRASMMVSLESRAAFLDNDLVDFCRRLPNGYKFRNGQRKFLLKKAVAGLLPQFVLRRKKKGFGIPVHRWLSEVPKEPPLAAIPGIRIPWVSDRWTAFRSHRTDERLFLWSWLSLQYAINTGAGETASFHRPGLSAQSADHSLAVR